MEWINQQLATSLDSWYLAIILVYLGGVLTSATPCIYPIIPITVGVIGANNQGSKQKAFFLSLVYVAGLAVVYGTLGIVASLTGQMFGDISTNPWTFFLVANLCFFFSFWMMDWISIGQIQILKTESFDNSSHGEEKKKSQFRWGRVFLMGAVSGLVAGPCAAPVLGTLLTFVATTNSIVFGGTLLIAFAYGMGTILIVIGTFSGVATSIPKSGKWMIWVKRVLALCMFAAGQYFLILAGQELF